MKITFNYYKTEPPPLTLKQVLDCTDELAVFWLQHVDPHKIIKIGEVWLYVAPNGTAYNLDASLWRSNKFMRDHTVSSITFEA